MSVLSSSSVIVPSAGEKIPVARIHPHPQNPRADFSNARDLAESIREHGGHPFNPILARPYSGDYEIVSGHTRFISLKQYLNFAQVEVGLDIVIREIDDQTAIRLMVDDNVKRWQYNPAEFAEALKLLVNSCGLSIREVARRYGVDHAWLLRVLKVAELPDRVRSRVVWGKSQLSRGPGDLPHQHETTSRSPGAVSVSHAEVIVSLDTRSQKEAVATGHREARPLGQRDNPAGRRHQEGPLDQRPRRGQRGTRRFRHQGPQHSDRGVSGHEDSEGAGGRFGGREGSTRRLCGPKDSGGTRERWTPESGGSRPV